jgi:hypothetical protein
MSRIFASIGRHLHRRLGRPPHDVDPQATSLLLCQPLDILFQIFEYLPPESFVAVALTCKLAFHSFFPVVKDHLDNQGLQNLLLLLEESVSRDHFFCYNCTQLHRFSPYWAPGHRRKDIREPRCKPDTINLGDLFIGSHHVRLIMNAHLFGPGRGLSISRLETKIPPYWEGWETRTVARIVQNQLLLRVSHRLILHQKGQLHNRPIESIMLMYYRRNICPHITTHPYRRYGGSPNNSRQIPELSPSDPRFTHNNNILESCDNVPGSCHMCLTDFTTTIKLRRANASGSELELLDVAITAYHQLGGCRSPLDWQWQMISAQPSNHRPELITRAQRGSCYEPGIVRRQWNVETSEPATDSGKACFGGRPGKERQGVKEVS